MFWMPLSGSLVTQSVAVKYGAASKPGVEIGTGSNFNPPSGFFRSSPLMTTSWHGAELTRTGLIGCATASIQALPISSTGLPMPMA
jgi:hypothetical protein